MGEITEALKRAGGARRRARRARRASEFPEPAATPPAAPSPADAEGPGPSGAVAPPPEPSRRGTPIAERLGLQPTDPSASSPPTGVPEPEGLRLGRDRGRNWPARTVIVDEHGGGSESYRHFALQVLRGLQACGEHSVLIASALREEGKTTTACNLSLALASMAGGRRIALVDLDLRRPSVGASLGLRVQTGIERVLKEQAELDEACIATVGPPLDIYPVRDPTPSAHELLARPSLARTLEELAARYDFVVVDSAPVLLVPDTGLILPCVGGCIAVSRARRTRRASFKQMLELIPEGKLLGTFLNESRAPRHSKQYGYYYAGDPESADGGV